MELDKLDREILNILLENSKLAYRKIAERVGVVPATVMHRIKRLENEKIIKSYTIDVDTVKTGYEFEVLIDMVIDKGQDYLVSSRIIDNPQIARIYKITGAMDVELVAKFKTRKELDKFLQTIQEMEYVNRTETKLVLNTIKKSEVII